MATNTRYAHREANKAYVIRAAKMMNLDFLKPTPAAPEILVMDWSSGHGVVVVDALRWSEARDQINAFAVKHAQG